MKTVDILRTQNEVLSAENDALRTRLVEAEAHVKRLQLILSKGRDVSSKWRAACVVAKATGCTVQAALQRV